MKRDVWLITIDLDGTLLKDGKSGVGNYEFHEDNLKVINKLISMGHKVCIVTGRPWFETENIYNALGLNTIVANYNGAHIHNPSDDGFDDLSYSINRDLVFEILNDDLVKKATFSTVVETSKETYVNGNMENNVFVHGSKRKNLHEWNIEEKLPTNPRAILINLNFKKVDPYDVLDHLKRYYGNSMFFRLWNGVFKEQEWIQMEINQKSANKGTAMQHMASYYNIPLSNTITFGDGLNDREMLEKASVGVAMKNAKGTVKTYSDDITDFDNNDAGVARYLEKFFNIKKAD